MIIENLPTEIPELPSTNSVTNDLQDVTGKVVQDGKMYMDQFDSVKTSSIKTLTTQTTNLTSKGKELCSNLTSKVTGKLKSVVSTSVSTLKTAATGLASQYANMAKTTISNVQSTVSSTKESLSNVSTNLKSTLESGKSSFTSLKSNALVLPEQSNLKEAKANLDNLTDISINKASQVKNLAQTGLVALNNKKTEIESLVKKTTGLVQNSATTAVSTAQTIISSNVSTTQNIVKTQVPVDRKEKIEENNKSIEAKTVNILVENKDDYTTKYQAIVLYMSYQKDWMLENIKNATLSSSASVEETNFWKDWTSYSVTTGYEAWIKYIDKEFNTEGNTVLHSPFYPLGYNFQNFGFFGSKFTIKTAYLNKKKNTQFVISKEKGNIYKSGEKINIYTEKVNRLKTQDKSRYRALFDENFDQPSAKDVNKYESIELALPYKGRNAEQIFALHKKYSSGYVTKFLYTNLSTVLYDKL